MPEPDCAAVATELRRHLPAVRACIAVLGEVAAVSERARVGADPHGLLWPEVGRVMAGLHLGNEANLLILRHNFVLFEVRLRHAASAYARSDAAAADAAVLEGIGVPDIPERTPRPAEPGSLPAPAPTTLPSPASIADWRARLHSMWRLAPRLFGDSAAIAERAAMWRELARRLERAADAIAAAVNTELESWRGPGAAYYRSLVDNNIELIRDCRRLCDQLADIVDVCGWLSLASRRLYELTVTACLAELGGAATPRVRFGAWVNGAAAVLWELSYSHAEISRQED